jgi:hypothetical protein
MSVRDMHHDDCLGRSIEGKLEVSNLLSNKRSKGLLLSRSLGKACISNFYLILIDDILRYQMQKKKNLFFSPLVFPKQKT